MAIPSNFKSYWDDVYSDGKTIYKEDYISVDVKREDITTPYLVLKKRADGYNQPLDMKVPLEIVGNKVMLPNYLSYPYKNRFRDYRLDYDLVVPKNMKVIKLADWGISLDDDTPENNYNNNFEEKSKITVNGKTWEIIKNSSDSVIINNKKYGKDEAERLMDSLNLKIDELKNVDISIKDGKKEISIKTNK